MQVVKNSLLKLMLKKEFCRDLRNAQEVGEGAIARFEELYNCPIDESHYWHAEKVFLLIKNQELDLDSCLNILEELAKEIENREVYNENYR